MGKYNANIVIEAPADWGDYELIDSGDGYKLERFGEFYLSRPEPKALWSKSLPESKWNSLAHTIFRAGAGFGKAGKEDVGTWEMLKKMPQQWSIEYLGAEARAERWSAIRHGAKAVGGTSRPQGLYMKLRLGLTSFKHVGVFPEQAPNWDWIYTHTRELCNKGAISADGPAAEDKVRVLNLFAYTGAASLAARCAGAEVTHVDSVKQVVNWGKENLELSGLKDIRWIIDDALKFVKREIRRGNLYNGIILDPPAYGHGPDGERWKLDELLFEMVSECKKILKPHGSFVVLNLYSNGYSALLAHSLIKKAFGLCENRGIESTNSLPFSSAEISCGELVLPDKFGKVIPLSVFARLYNP